MSENGFKNRIVLAGQLVNKRFKKFESGKCVLELFVRSSAGRGTFCVSCKQWGDAAIATNKKLSNLGIDDREVLDKDEAPMLKIKGALKQEAWKDDNDEWVRQFIVSMDEVSINA